MKIVFNCHTEYDLKNEFGVAKQISADQQSYQHIPILIDWLSNLNLPISYALAVGGPFQDNLLKYLKNDANKIKELGIHFHSEKYLNKKWKWNGFLSRDEYQGYYKKFVEILDRKPEYMIFGKWKIDQINFDFLSSLGIKQDTSWVDQEKTIKAPFLINEILEIPVISYHEKQLNPFTRLSHFFLLRKIIKEYHQEDLLIQVGFHSYDLFDFNQGPKLRKIKQKIMENILKLIKSYQIEIIQVKQVELNNWQELNSIKMPILGKIFNLLGH